MKVRQCEILEDMGRGLLFLKNDRAELLRPSGQKDRINEEEVIVILEHYMIPPF